MHRQQAGWTGIRAKGGRFAMRRRLASAIAIAASIAAVIIATRSDAADRPRAVIELFTSQGCSSCPPADALLGELAQDPRIVALTLPVDYWDYLGWKDTLASHAYTERQRGYADARGDRKVYTPQVVVNGLAHAVGSDRSAIEQAIVRTNGGAKSLTIEAGLERAGDGVALSVAPGQAPSEGADVLLAWVDSIKWVRIERGENTGREIAYHNVVRRLSSVGRWTGAALRLELPDILLTPGQRLAVIVQAGVQGRPGAILAAAMRDLGLPANVAAGGRR
jgi:hypothetical protein